MIHHLKLQRIGIVPAAKNTAPSGVANVAGPSFLPGLTVQWFPGEQVIKLSEASFVPNAGSPCRGLFASVSMVRSG